MPSNPAPLVLTMVTAPPLNVPAPSTLLSEIASAATVLLEPSDAKVTPLPPTDTPSQLIIRPVVVLIVLPEPWTVIVPPPVALKPVPLVVAISSPLPPQLKLIVPP